ncbi:MAG: AbrB/MazE/SpoVT family DNA-binding domain-containing protein [Chloroflexi bacterium]|nr:AbrB/MazE/SpoVT family DNA-binding domain-containing protein [Chloroflexota bacterium]
MNTTRLSSKGQVIIPKNIRDEYQWTTGLEFFVIDTTDGVLLKPKRPFSPTKIDEVAGCLRYQGTAKTIEEMEQAIQQGILEQWDDRR